MSYFAVEYTIHFDDTMAYGSHHFVTAFKFQCAARESYLFGARIYDFPGARDALAAVHLLTMDAYARNLNPAKLGDRVAILLTFEDWGRASTRFCFRVIDAKGRPICAGFQTVLCADANTGVPISLPRPLWDAMRQMREIEERRAPESFRDRVLAGGAKTELLFSRIDRAAAIEFLAERYPHPRVIAAASPMSFQDDVDAEAQSTLATPSASDENAEAWVFSGQGAYDPRLLSTRVVAYMKLVPGAQAELEQCAAVARELLGGEASALISGSSRRCGGAVEATPDLSQVAIHLQNMLGARIRRSRGRRPSVLIGHSFGEIAALGFAGCYDMPTGVRIVCERARAIGAHAPPSGSLLAVAADRPRVAAEVALLGLDQVVIAGRNHPHQTVASGPRDQLEMLRAHLRDSDVHAVMVATPTSFHHPRLRAAASAWLAQLRTLPLGGPALPVYSPIGRRLIAPGDDIAATLASQLVRPFDFQGAIHDITNAGVTRFIDCGSTGATARIISKAAASDVKVGGIDLDETGTTKAAERAPVVPARTGPRRPAAATTSADGNNGRSRATSREQVPNAVAATDRSVAIVAQGCILPGGAHTPERLFSAITERRMGIVDLRRVDPHWSEDFYSAKLVPDRSTTHLAGRIDDGDIVVPDGVDPDLFHRFTRAQRLLCVALAPCVAALENAKRILCFIGATADGFEDQDVVSSLRFAGIDPTDPEVDRRIGCARSAFQEPHDAVREVFDHMVRPGLEIVLVDAACASSLYAIALGMQTLELNEADAVVAGGVFCPGPGNSCLFSQFHGTSSTGCRPFDKTADGVVFSEGAALVVLRRVADAVQLGLPVAGVLQGAGLSSDGRSPSASVPQTRGQILSLQRCYADYDIDPASIRAIEGHGTGTPVGDTTEVETLRQFFAQHMAKPVPLHSLKGLLGHTGWAAGAAAVIAACAYLRHGLFPAQACHDEPSDALARAAGTLTIPKRPLSLPAHHCRLAIDGFGFGGANAHLVLGRHAAREPGAHDSLPASDAQDRAGDDLVFVAHSDLPPTDATPSGPRFDREKVKLPERYVLLPDVVDDMDISQTLALVLADKIVAQLAQLDDAVRHETSVVLAQSGKTERGVEATTRVLAPRFRRTLAPLDAALEQLAAACDRARPSGPYTLQCMMPNVGAGRVAQLLDLNGPNFVVDSGPNSLEAALTAARLLLRGDRNSGMQLVVVMAINANPWRVPDAGSQQPENEYAAAFAITTRRHAERHGWKIVSDVAGALQECHAAFETEPTAATTAEKVRALLDVLDAAAGKNNAAGPNGDGRRARSAQATANTARSSARTQFPIHVPAWVEAPLADGREAAERWRAEAIVAIVPADPKQVAELAAVLPRYAKRHLVAVVGAAACDVAAACGARNVVAVDMADGRTIEEALAQIDDLGPDVVVAVESITSWDLSEALAGVANDNGLCEFLFLVAQRGVARLHEGAMALWGLFVNGWNGVVHPASGAIAGLLKAIGRETGARTGTVCTRGRDLASALERVFVEHLAGNPEPEVVHDGPRRLVRRLRQPAHGANALRSVALDADSVVVATGGARGVTAVLMDALCRDYGCTVVALGRSEMEAGPFSGDTGAAESLQAFPSPDAERDYYDRFVHAHPNATAAEMKASFERACARWEAHRTIQHLAALGARVEYMVADVTDRKQVATAVERIAAKHGRIDLLVHGAGIQLSKRLEHRGLADFQKTFAVKVGGLHNLVEACRKQFGKTVPAHVLTSAYSIFGNDGQHDYGAANETLDRLCDLTTLRGDPRWSSVAWLAWDGIGMTRGSEYRALAKQRNLSALTAEDGQRIFRAVVSGQTAAAINVPLSEAEHVRYGVKTIPPAPRAVGGRVIEVGVELAKIECLSHHKIRKTPTLPGAWILERMADAALRLRHDADRITSVTFRDVAFRRFARLVADREPNLRIVAEEVHDGISVWMIGDVLHSSGITLSKDVLFAQAKLSFQHDGTPLRPALHDIAAPNGHGINRRVSDPYCAGRCDQVELSGPFDCLRDIVIGPHGRRARFSVNNGGDVSGGIPALLIDSAWRVGAMYAVPESDELYVPVHIGRVVAPIGTKASEGAMSDWEIRATAPRLDKGAVRLDRTEVLNGRNDIKLIVENALATPLNADRIRRNAIALEMSGSR